MIIWQDKIPQPTNIYFAWIDEYDTGRFDPANENEELIITFRPEWV